MLFEKPDPNWLHYMQILMKRIKSFPKVNDEINKSHPIYVKWCNIKMFIEASKEDGDKKYFYTESIIYLTLLSKYIEDFSKENMLADDDTLKYVLHDASQYMFFDPMKLQVQ